MYAHCPGLKVVMPSTPYDAKGLLVSSVRDQNPVVYIDDRWLYSATGEVPEHIYEIPIGQAAVRKQGRDATVVATSYMSAQAMIAAAELANEGIDIEVVDLRSLKPIDKDAILQSVKKTGRLVVADAAWLTCGFAAEISAIVADQGFEFLKAPILRVALPDSPAPMSESLERAYYPTSRDVAGAVRRVVAWSHSPQSDSRQRQSK